MHAALRRMRCAPGQAGEVARLIKEEYLPQLASVPGVVSYTLVHPSQDEITSVGVFLTQEGAAQANALAQTWVKERLADLGAAPLEALEGDVLVHSTFPV